MAFIQYCHIFVFHNFKPNFLCSIERLYVRTQLWDRVTLLFIQAIISLVTTFAVKNPNKFIYVFFSFCHCIIISFYLYSMDNPPMVGVVIVIFRCGDPFVSSKQTTWFQSTKYLAINQFKFWRVDSGLESICGVESIVKFAGNISEIALSENEMR